jgi:hypothetical protein
MRRLRAGNRHWHNHCGSEVRGKWAPRREVGKMGYLMMGIALVVLAVIAAVRTRTGHA